MMFHLRDFAMALALLAGISAAAAQTGTVDTRLDLSQAEKTQIYRTLAIEGAGSGLKEAQLQSESIEIGKVLPSATPLRDIPRSTAAQIPAIAPYKFTVFGRDVAIVEPKSRQVIEILSE